MKEDQKDRLIPLTMWNEFYPWPPVGGLRHLVSHAKEKKFEKVVVRAGLSFRSRVRDNFRPIGAPAANF